MIKTLSLSNIRKKIVNFKEESCSAWVDIAANVVLKCVKIIKTD